MILVVAPEPPLWLPFVLEREGAALDDITFVSMWSIVRRGSNAWASGRTDRQIAARFALRDATDRVAARRLTDEVTTIYAPSLAAQRTFARARRNTGPTRCVLVEDLPDLRQLHDDLDRAAIAHPEFRFLNRYRADRSRLSRQVAERVLADFIVVRGDFARRCRLASGLDPGRVELLGRPAAIATRRAIDGHRPTLLLAGLATARGGLAEALAALDAIPEASLVVRAGEGLEPADALAHPRVRQGSAAEFTRLDDIDLVVAPSWCEAALPEISLAAGLGIPIVATERAAGMVDLDKVGVAIDPGDVEGLVAAITLMLRRA